MARGRVASRTKWMCRVAPHRAQGMEKGYPIPRKAQADLRQQHAGGGPDHREGAPCQTMHM